MAQLHDSLWGGLDGQQHSRCAACLKLLAHFLEGHSAAAVAAAASFAAMCQTAAPSLDCKLVLDQLVAAAAIGTPGSSLSSHTADLAESIAQNVAVEAAAEFGRDLEALAAAGKDAGVAIDLPTASEAALFAFCGALVGSDGDLETGYAEAAELLPLMEEAQARFPPLLTQNP